jgi:hypothetical protein
MTVWDYPVFIVAAVAGCLVVAWSLMRVGRQTHRPDFECDVCGRKQRGLLARDWRFCPYCGTPRPRRQVW